MLLMNENDKDIYQGICCGTLSGTVQCTQAGCTDCVDVEVTMKILFIPLDLLMKNQ